MNVAKKILNVFGILIAWILSIVMVLMLIAAPLMQSALSLLEPEVITQVVISIFNQEDSASAAPVQKDEGYGLVSLSNASEQRDSSGDDLSGMLNVGALEGFFGADLDDEIVNKILSSKAAQKFIETYTEDLTNALTGGSGESKFNAEKVIEIVDEHMDEIMGIIKEVSPEITEEEVETLKEQIRNAVRENADKIVQAMPKPEQIVEEIKNASPELEMAFELLAQKNNIKMALTGVIVALSLLIFLCRIPGFRGLRWLATNLFVGFGFNALLCGGLLFGGAAVEGMMAANPQMTGMVRTILSALTVNMLIRTGVILVSAVALLLAYIFIKKARAKKVAAMAAPVVAPVEDANEEPAEETAQQDTVLTAEE